ncbi:MAG: antitoxin family protein [Beijerinckiaceae bacterium]
MNITIEAIYEAGVLKPLQPLPGLKEREKVRLTVEVESALDRLLQQPIEIDPAIAREIAESADFSMLES